MTTGFAEVPFNRVLRTIQNMQLHSPGYMNALGKQGREILHSFLLEESYSTQRAIQDEDPAAFFDSQFQCGELVTPSPLRPFIEIIGGPGVNESQLIKGSTHNLGWLESQQDSDPQGPLLSHDLYTICRSNHPSAIRLMYDHRRIPERILEPMSQIYQAQPITNRGPVQELLLKRTLALEGRRVPYKFEMESGFDLKDLNLLLAHRYQLHPYLLMVLEALPLACTHESSQLLAQKIRIIKDLAPGKGKLSQRIAVCRVPLTLESEMDQPIFDGALTNALTQLSS
jgi:hypothetical protein